MLLQWILWEKGSLSLNACKSIVGDSKLKTLHWHNNNYCNCSTKRITQVTSFLSNVLIEKFPCAVFLQHDSLFDILLFQKQWQWISSCFVYTTTVCFFHAPCWLIGLCWFQTLWRKEWGTPYPCMFSQPALLRCCRDGRDTHRKWVREPLAFTANKALSHIQPLP